MDENECLVGELRKYLSTAKYKTQNHESEQVQALKRDLNLAARVGQQLLMQLRSAEKTRAKTEQDVEDLRQKNSKLAEENHQLACEHELMTETICQQEAEIASLAAKLQATQSKTERLKRAHTAAKALEREVQLLERMQLDLRAELEKRTQQREDAQKLARHLASSLAQHVASDFADLKRETEFDVPSLTRDTTEYSEERTAVDSAHLLKNNNSFAQGYTSFDSASEIDLSIADLSIHPTAAGTPIKKPSSHRTPMPSHAEGTHSIEPLAEQPVLEQSGEPLEPPKVEARTIEPLQPIAEQPKVNPPSTEQLVAEPSVTKSPVAEPPVAEPPVAEPPAAGLPVAERPLDGLHLKRQGPEFPMLMRSRSHESVLSIRESPPPLPMVSSTSRLQTTALPKAVTAVSDEYSLAQGAAVGNASTSRSARDKLSQMRAHTTAPDRRRWAFTPFRALH